MRWKIKKDGNKEQIAQLKKDLVIPEIIAKLLVERDITTFDAAKNFFRPSLDLLYTFFRQCESQKRQCESPKGALAMMEFRFYINQCYSIDPIWLTISYDYMNSQFLFS